jgi:hypothetical protein
LDTAALLNPDSVTQDGVSDIRIGTIGSLQHVNSTSTNVGLALYFDLQDDSHMRNIYLNMNNPGGGALAQLCYFNMDGTLTIATSTSITTAGSIQVTWSLGTGIGTYGDRFPALTGSAVDLALIITNTGANNSGLAIYGGTYEYDIMRF